MEIIKPGKLDTGPWSQELTCTGRGNGDKGCEALLKVDRDDLRYYEGQEFPWRVSEAAVCFKCPCCGKVTDLKKDMWPVNHHRLALWSSEWHTNNQI